MARRRLWPVVLAAALAAGAAGAARAEDDPDDTRLFFGPTARALAPGRGHAGLYEVGLPSLQVGLSDRVSMGAGTPIVLLGLFWFMPKVQLWNGPRTQVAAGVIHAVSLHGDGGGLGFGYGVMTRGGRDQSLTVGLGAGYGHGSARIGTRAIALIGGVKRVTPRLKLVSENYVWSGGGLVSGGVRVSGRRLSVDCGVLAALDGSGGAPVLNLVGRF